MVKASGTTKRVEMSDGDYRLVLFLIHARQCDLRRVKETEPGYKTMHELDVKLDCLNSHIRKNTKEV